MTTASSGEPMFLRAVDCTWTMPRFGRLDDGRTWSAPQPVHLPFPSGATSAASGNGNHGIQLADGRLLIQGGYVLKGTRHSCIFLSDDTLCFFFNQFQVGSGYLARVRIRMLVDQHNARPKS